jgi:cytochrome c-type biogenesis protein
MMKKILVTVFVCLFIFAAGCLALGQYKPSVFSRHEKVPAPDFTLKDIYGKTFRLSAHRGYPVIMFFGATWCGACRGEMPYFKNLYDQYAQQGLKFIYIDVNESTERVARFARQNAFPYQVLVDPYGSVATDYNIIGVPTVFLLDKNRNIVGISHRIVDLKVDKIFPAIR